MHSGQGQKEEEEEDLKKTEIALYARMEWRALRLHGRRGSTLSEVLGTAFVWIFFTDVIEQGAIAVPRSTVLCSAIAARTATSEGRRRAS